MSSMTATRQSAASPRPRLVGLACVVLLSAATAALSTSAAPAHLTAPGVDAAAPGDVRAAAKTARAFCEDYLAWLTGHHRASRIAGASPALRARLAAERVRPSRARQRQRQITELRTDLTTPTTGTAHAKVMGRDVHLRLTLTLVHATEGWVVSDVRS